MGLNKRIKVKFFFSMILFYKACAVYFLDPESAFLIQRGFGLGFFFFFGSWFMYLIKIQMWSSRKGVYFCVQYLTSAEKSEQVSADDICRRTLLRIYHQKENILFPEYLYEYQRILLFSDHGLKMR